MARILIAPDSFKGSASAIEVAEAIRAGWAEVRPSDELVVLPMADGGEGTLEAIAGSLPGAAWQHHEVTGPAGTPVTASWLMLPDGTAVLELAESSGLPLMGTLDPIGATTRGLGELICIAMDAGAQNIVIALGGSATTDAGLGALEALRLAVSRAPGGRGVVGVEAFDTSALMSPPPGGITLLSDTSVTMLDAPRVFGPQKGASDDDVSLLVSRFEWLLELAGDETSASTPGSGAAGATAWGLMVFLGAEVVGGAEYVSQLVGLDEQLSRSALVITGEGAFDDTSSTGKVTGEILTKAKQWGVPAALIVGTSRGTPPEVPMMRLVDDAASAAEAMAAPDTYIVRAARFSAEQFTKDRIPDRQ